MLRAFTAAMKRSINWYPYTFITGLLVRAVLCPLKNFNSCSRKLTVPRTVPPLLRRIDLFSLSRRVIIASPKSRLWRDRFSICRFHLSIIRKLLNINVENCKRITQKRFRKSNIASISSDQTLPFSSELFSFLTLTELAKIGKRKKRDRLSLDIEWLIETKNWWLTVLIYSDENIRSSILAIMKARIYRE